MDKHLQQAFREMGISDPTQYVQETIDRLNTIEKAQGRQQQIAKTLLSSTNTAILPQIKALLESIK